jgi:hypothetical protein
MRIVFKFVFVIAMFLTTATAYAFEVKVWPDKLCVKPAEPVNIRVEVSGLPEGKSAEIQCIVETDLKKEVAKFEGQASSTAPAIFTFTPESEWGYSAVAVAKAGDETFTASEVFACAKNPYMVAPDYSVPEVYGQDTLPDGSAAPDGRWPANPHLEKAIEREVAKFRNLYLTVGELMGPAFCSFSSIKPPVPNYFKAHHYNYSANAIRGVIDKLHENGISTVIYVNACLTGLAGTEFARKHPEYLAYQPDGMPFGSIYMEPFAAQQEYVENYPASLKRAATDPEYRKLLVGGYPGFLNAYLDFEDVRVAEFGAEKIIEGQEYFGYDGVRYDGEYRVPSIGDPLAPSRDLRNWKGEKQKTGQEAVNLTVRNLRRAYGMMREHDPEFLIGLNFADFRSDGAGDRLLETETVKTISPGIWILDEVAKGALSPAHPDNRWENFIVNMSEQADRVRKVDDYLFAGWGGGPGKNVTDTKLVKAVSYACGLRWICGGYAKEGPFIETKRLYNRFALRFSRFILNNRLERLAAGDAEKSIAVSADRPVLWQRFVYRLPGCGAGILPALEDSRPFLVLHLINKPLEESLSAEAEMPPVATGVNVELDPAILSSKPQLDAIAAISPDDDPSVRSVQSAEKNGKLVLKVPDVKLWTVLVIPCEVKQ